MRPARSPFLLPIPIEQGTQPQGRAARVASLVNEHTEGSELVLTPVEFDARLQAGTACVASALDGPELPIRVRSPHKQETSGCS